jgi:periplasmic protein CpxP/Spy
MIKKLLTAPILLAMLVWFAASASAQFGQRRLPNRGINRPPIENPQAGRQPGTNQAKKQRLQQQLMQRLGLTPDQRVRMQEIRRNHDDEVISSGRRLRQARAALDRAVMSENYSEEAVRRATEELVAAQADRIRLQARIRAQVRGVLTTEQVQEFNRLQREIRREMQQQRREMQERQMGAAAPREPIARPPLEDDGFDLVSLLFFEN